MGKRNTTGRGDAWKTVKEWGSKSRKEMARWYRGRNRKAAIAEGLEGAEEVCATCGCVVGAGCPES